MSRDDAEETGYSWEERFRDALSQGSEEAVAKALQKVNSLDRSGIEALANLFEAGAEDHGVGSDLYQHKLFFRRRRRGAPKAADKITGTVKGHQPTEELT
jgi:hypothetical protein